MSALEFIELVRAAGAMAAPIFAILFWLERDERKDAQKELREVSNATAVALNELKMMISNLASLFDRTARNKRE